MPTTTPSFVYPTFYELSAIDPDFVARLTQDNPIFRMFPMRNVDAALVEWEQRDNYVGLMQARGLEGEYPSVPRVATNLYSMDPGRYGEHMPITGREVETRRAFGTVNQPIDVRDLTVERQEQLATRQVNLQSYIMWSLMTDGTYKTVAHNGAIVKRDAINFQKFTANPLWSSPTTATPLADFRAIKLLHRGHSAVFDGTCTAWMNTQTFNYLIANTNAADLGGRRSAGLETIEGLDQFNTFIAMRDNLPKIVEFDDGYLDNNGTFQLFIPDGKVILMGRRMNNAPLGDFALTRNADNNNSSAPLVKVVEKGTGPDQAPPMQIAVYRGFNGGPRIYYPGSVVVMTVA